MPFGESRLITTVESSGASAPPALTTPARPAPTSTMRSIVATTSAAVSGAPPSCQVTPGRSLKVHWLASAFGDHSVASAVAAMLPSGPRPTRYSNDCDSTAYVPRSSMLTGSRPELASPVWIPATMSPPAAAGASVATGAGAAAGASVPAGAAGAAGAESLSLPPQAAMMPPMTGTDRPIIVPRRTKSRRLTFPCAYDSMRSSSIGPTELRV